MQPKLQIRLPGAPHTQAHAELWQAMKAGESIIMLDAPCGARKARKQLLSRLTKQSLAAAYAWVALADPAATTNKPSIEEGWAAIF